MSKDKDDEMGGGIDKALATALKQAKSKTMYAAVVVKNGTEGALLVSKRKIPPAAITLAKKECGGNKVFKGTCFVEDGKHIFEMVKAPPPTLAKLIKILAKTHAKLMIRPICRLKSNAEIEEDEVEEEEVEEVVLTGSGPDPAMAKYQTELKTLASDLKQVLTLDGVAAEAVRKQFLLARTTAKSNRYAEAFDELSALRPLLAKALEEAAAEPEEDDGGEFAEVGNAWHKRREALMFSLKQVKDLNPQTFNSIKGPFQEAVALAGGKKFQEALELLEASNIDAEIAKALKAGRVEEASTGITGKVEFATALLKWQATLGSATSELGKLQGEIRSKYPQESALAEDLNQVLSDFQGGLMNVLDEGRAGETEDDFHSSKVDAVAAIKHFRSLVGTSVVIPIIDRCPIITISLRRTLLDGLAEVQSDLNA